MNSRLHAISLAVVVAAASPLIAGCAEDSSQREAAYPQAVGETIPPSDPPEQVADTEPPPAPTPPPPPPPRAPVTIGVDEAPAASMPADEAGGLDDGYADTDPSALQDFRGALSPYGSWVDDPTYGTVWVPSTSVVGNDFTPYVSGGRWAYDDQNDYTWVSDYDWGWAPFHYGRWVYDGPTGWAWIPGRRYAGAWVSWRYGVGDWGYVGWAPMAPAWGWRGGAAFNLGFAPRMPYSFCASGALFAPHVGAEVVTGPQVGTIAANTRPWTGSGLNGRVTASPTVGGPPPSTLRIAASAVAGVGANRGIAQARAFARPSTGMALGASSPRFASVSRAPVYRAPQSHFGGRLGAGFTGAGVHYPVSRAYYGSGRYSSVGPGVRGGYTGSGGFSAYRAPSSGGGSYHGAAATHGGSTFRSGGFHGGGGGHGGGRR